MYLISAFSQYSKTEYANHYYYSLYISIIHTLTMGYSINSWNYIIQLVHYISLMLPEHTAKINKTVNKRKVEYNPLAHTEDSSLVRIVCVQ